MPKGTKGEHIMKTYLKIEMKKRNVVKTNYFYINKNNEEQEIKYWLWNVQYLGNWKVLNYEIITTNDNVSLNWKGDLV